MHRTLWPLFWIWGLKATKTSTTYGGLYLTTQKLTSPAQYAEANCGIP